MITGCSSCNTVVHLQLQPDKETSYMVGSCSNCGKAIQVEIKDIKVPCEVYSRIVGYLRPVQNWNAAKQQEFTDRKTFKIRS